MRKKDQQNGRNRKQKIAACTAVEKNKIGSNWAGRATLDGEGEDHEGQAERKRGTRRRRRASGNIMKESEEEEEKEREIEKGSAQRERK